MGFGKAEIDKDEEKKRLSKGVGVVTRVESTCTYNYMIYIEKCETACSSIEATEGYG